MGYGVKEAIAYGGTLRAKKVVHVTQHETIHAGQVAILYGLIGKIFSTSRFDPDAVLRAMLIEAGVGSVEEIERRQFGEVRAFLRGWLRSATVLRVAE